MEQSAASGSEDTTVEKQVNVTTTAGSTDTTPVEQAAQAALSGETSTTDTTMTTNLTVEAGSTDATPAAHLHRRNLIIHFQHYADQWQHGCDNRESQRQYSSSLQPGRK